MLAKRSLLVVVATMLFLTALASSVAASSPRSGALDVEKECSTYVGQAGGICTNVIEPQSHRGRLDDHLSPGSGLHRRPFSPCQTCHQKFRRNATRAMTIRTDCALILIDCAALTCCCVEAQWCLSIHGGPGMLEKFPGVNHLFDEARRGCR